MGVSTHIQGASKHRGAPYVWMPPEHTQHKESMLCQSKGVSICPHTFGCPSVCLDAPICLDGPLYVWMPHMPSCMLGHPHMFGCPLYMHNTKKACFVRVRGCPYAPIHLDAPLYVWMPPYVWMAPCMFGCPICLPVCLDTLICLDAPCTCTTQRKHALSDEGGVHMPPYMWMPPVHQQHKESMLCQIKGVSICPHTFGCPHMFGYPICLNAPLYVWMSPYVWMTPVCFDTPMFG